MKDERGRLNSTKEFDKWLRDRGFTRREARALSFTFGRLYVTKDKPKNPGVPPNGRTIAEIISGEKSRR